MIKNDNIILKVKKRQLNTPGLIPNKNIHIFGEQKKNLQNNRPKSKNKINNSEKKSSTQFGFYHKQNNNKKPVNLFNNKNNVNNMNLKMNNKNIQFKKKIFSEEKNNNKKIYLLNNFAHNKNINLNNMININNNLSKSQNKNYIYQNEVNPLNKLIEINDLKKKKIFLNNKINLIKIEENKNKNLNDIFPKIKHIPKLKENVIDINKDNNLNQVIKNKDIHMKLNFNNNNKPNKKIKVVFPNNNLNKININNNQNINLNKNLKYILKNKSTKNEQNGLIDMNKNIFNNKQNKYIFKLNINNNINNIDIKKQINNGKSSDKIILKNCNNNFFNRNIRLQRNKINKSNIKNGSLEGDKKILNPKDFLLNEQNKIVNTAPENKIQLKDYFHREEVNSQIKDSMEDFILVKHPFISIEKNNISIFSIFDGHGGDFVAKYLKENFATFLEDSIKVNYSLNFRGILNTTFQSIDKSLEKYEQAENCGSTAVVVVVNNNNIYCANVGDSKCFYLNKNNVVQLTEDHNCKNEKEKEELKKKGILIFQNRVFGSLSLTRTMGDLEFKREGVTCIPYIKKIFLDEDDVNYIVIASDGIWDVVNEEKLFEIYKGLKKGISEEFCNLLVDYAMNNGSGDNISCIVLRF